MSQHPHEPCSRPQRRFSGHPDGASGAAVAANDRQPAVIAFMGGRAARRQPARQLRGIKARQREPLSGKPAVEAQGVVVQLTHRVAGFTGQ
nr:Uncharacterised protein [Raoultella sp. NCTC 9187]